MISLHEKANIIGICEKENFSQIKFAKYELLSNEIENYKEWLSLGYNADMEWMKKNLDKREDVSLIQENAKSVIVLAYNYNQSTTHESNENKISRYAWGDDYHNYIPKKLKKISNELKSLYPNEEFKYYVDTGAILEKQWGIKAGLGWQGKNSLLLNKKLGSYFFISVIITTLEVEHDDLVKDYCGKCSKCIDACPTNAIISDKVVDSTKCISYWTIESKSDSFPTDISENLEGWAFGCDICQEVCPWNNHRVPIQIEDFVNPRYGETVLDKETVFNYTEDEFKERYIKSPLKRPKHYGIKRNILELEKNSK